MDALTSALNRLANPGQDTQGPLAESFTAILDGLCRALVTAGISGVSGRAAAELLAGLQAVQQIAKNASQASPSSGSGPWSYTLESIPLGGCNLALRCEAPQIVELGFQLDRDFYLHGILSLIIESGQDEQVFSFDLEQAKDGWVLRRWDRDVPVQSRLEFPAGSVVPWKAAGVFDFLAPLLTVDLSAGAVGLKTASLPNAAPMQPLPEVPAAAPPLAMQPTLIHQALPPQALALVVKDRRLPLSGRLTMGRGTSNDLCLTDPRASRYHAVIESTPGGWAVRDLNSANGTWLNGNRISAAKLLKAGDSLVVGDTEMQIVASA